MHRISIAPTAAGALILASSLVACDSGTDAERDELFAATLSGQAEVPAVSTNASGAAEFTHDVSRNELRYELSVANLENAIAAHIHFAAAGENGPIVAFLFQSDTPVSTTGSTVLEQGTVGAADVRAVEGFDGTFAGLIAQMRVGNTYVNVHTTQNTPGEIRGQIAAVP